MLLYKLVKPGNLLRIGLLAFLLTSLFLRLPTQIRLAVNPDSVQAAGACGSKCESAGHCWNEGTVAGQGGTGDQYVCQGGEWRFVSKGTAEQKATADALKQQYDQQVAAAGGGGGAATTTQSGIGITGGAVCGSGSASGCPGKSFYSRPDNTPADWVCFPNGVNQQGVTLCGRGPIGGISDASLGLGTSPPINIVTDPNTGKPISGNVLSTNRDLGGCRVVVQCGCPTGMQSLCLSTDKAPDNIASYCASTVCTPIGTNGKVCTPGQTKPGSCNGTIGEICNNSGTGYFSARAHACGATHTVAYCSQYACLRQSETYPNCPGGVACVGTTYKDATTCSTANSGAICQQGVAQITQSVHVATSYCTSACPASLSSSRQGCIDSCLAGVNTPGSTHNTAFNTAVATAQSAGGCVAGSSYRIFKGCGTGAQAQWNCYQVCAANGSATTQCWNEPGLSCGAHQVLTPVQQAIASVITSRTTVNTEPTPTPTATPTATCGQSCGNGVVCTGSNMACVSGTCRSTLCSADEQNAQCVCEEPPAVAPMCIDIFASKVNPALGDQVSFTCAQVDNAVRYEFLIAFTTSKTSVDGAQVQPLAPLTATSRVSQPITVDKVGRYIAMCRPCGPNDLCQPFEPLGGQIGPPRLAPEETAAVEAETAAGGAGEEATQESSEVEQEATSSATTEESNATESGTTQ